MEITTYPGMNKIKGPAGQNDKVGFGKAYHLALKFHKWSEAFPIWKDLADRGFVRSAFYTAVCYDEGLGVKKNRKLSFQYFLISAKKGHPESLYNVYLMYRDGIGVKKDLSAAIRWLKKAAKQKEIGAIRDLGYAYHEGFGVSMNLKLAAKLYLAAAKKGDKKAQWNLHLCYKNGEGVPESERWSKYWFRVASANIAN